MVKFKEELVLKMILLLSFHSYAVPPFAVIVFELPSGKTILLGESNVINDSSNGEIVISLDGIGQPFLSSTSWYFPISVVLISDSVVFITIPFLSHLNDSPVTSVVVLMVICSDELQATRALDSIVMFSLLLKHH